MILYLSGPITGIPDYKARFADAEFQLQKKGFTVINPARTTEGLTNADYMRISLAQLESADGIVLLGAWALSQGAVIEGLYAAYLGKQIFAARENPFSGELDIVAKNSDWMKEIAASGIIKRIREEAGLL